MSTLAEETFIETPFGRVLTGYIVLQRQTGWVQDPDGWWSSTGTPTRHYNDRGEVTKEFPYECYVRMNFGPERKARPWWKFWRA